MRSRLESEAIFILRETAAACQRPVLLFSGGKDSAVLVHLARKAFFPAPVPFPLLHIDTTWKFRELIRFRDDTARACGLTLAVYTNLDGLAAGVTPFTHSAAEYTRIMKTDALKQALAAGGFDAAIGGARRDEEPTRAKERICSFRTVDHRWDPRQQRPELWTQYNTRVHPGESVRVFPLSNWTELDVWCYIRDEGIAVPPLYFAAPRPVVMRAGQWVLVDDDRLPLLPGETASTRTVRFRTLGCYPLTGAMDSHAASVDALIDEMSRAPQSERSGRLIDRGNGGEWGGLEAQKREGYF